MLYNSRVTCTAHIDNDMFDTLFAFLHLLYICYFLLCPVNFPPPGDKILCSTFQINHDYIAAVSDKLNGHRKAHQARHTFNTKPNNSFVGHLSWGMAEIDLSIFSMNCNGLNDDLKRIAVFAKLKKKTNGIILLQETHSTPEMEQRWQNDWGINKCTFHTGLRIPKG